LRFSGFHPESLKKYPENPACRGEVLPWQDEDWLILSKIIN
jgi:hypothetical protein